MRCFAARRQNSSDPADAPITWAFATAGAWLAARLAPSRPLRHALILGGLGLALAVPVTIAHWHTAPVWFHVATLALTMPAAWVGGMIVEGRGGG
jgi:peptidoglycan/LPS O-acetylase OafA/YrhL